MTTQTDTYGRFPGIAVWNVMFLAGDRTSWWDYFTHKDWRHVCAFGYSVTTDSWVIYDVADTHSRISVVNAVWFDRWFAARRNKITACVQMPVHPGGGVRARLGLWCVTAIKHLLGLPSSALAPRALHRDLVRNGAKPSFEVEYGRKSESPARGRGNQSTP